MKCLPIALFVLALLPSRSPAQQQPQVPQLPQLPQPKVAPLCSAIKDWRVNFVSMVVSKTPGDGPGSHEEWQQNFILWGTGFPGTMQAETFEVNPRDNIPVPDPVETIFRPSGVGSHTLKKDVKEDRVIFSGKELDPFDDDQLPKTEKRITNPCHLSVANALTRALEFSVDDCADGHGRRACYTFTVTPRLP